MQAKNAIFMPKYYICTKHVVAELGIFFFWGGGGGENESKESNYTL